MANQSATLVLTAEAMREADRATIEDYGFPSFTLMESAARGALSSIEEHIGAVSGQHVLILAGKGNNGGDGLALARLLLRRGARVTVVSLPHDASTGHDTAKNLELLQSLIATAPAPLDLHVTDDPAVLDDLQNTLFHGDAPDICVDALLGIGAGGALRGTVSTLAGWAAYVPKVVCLDLPTGLDPDSGEVSDNDAVLADLTVAMGALKPGLLFGAGRTQAGKVVVVDIGVPRHIERAAVARPGCARIAGDDCMRDHMPRRTADAYKYTVGQCMVVAGSDRFSGAAMLSASAAARIGSGYVVCAATPRTGAALNAHSPSLALHPLRQADDGGIDPAEVPSLLEQMGRARCTLVGPGLGRSASTGEFVRALASEIEGQVVFDADGLYALSDRKTLEVVRERSKGQWVLTPHLGEFKRIVAAWGEDPEALDLSRMTWLCAEWAERLQVVLVLKGAPSVLSRPDGRTYIASHAEPALATAGSGDVLAGMIAGLMAQGVSPTPAAVLAFEFGGAAAQQWTANHAARAMDAGDIVAALPDLLGSRFAAR